MQSFSVWFTLSCMDTIGWVTGKASGLENSCFRNPQRLAGSILWKKRRIKCNPKFSVQSHGRGHKFVPIPTHPWGGHPISLSILTAIFPGEPGLASFIGAKDDGSGGDNWRYKTCKTPVGSSPPTNQHATFYRPDVLTVAQLTMSEHCWYICQSTCDEYSLQIIHKIEAGVSFYIGTGTGLQKSCWQIFSCRYWKMCLFWQFFYVAVGVPWHLFPSRGLLHYASVLVVYFYYCFYYLRWRMPPFMRQCWGLQVGPMHETTVMGKLINAALLLLMRRVWVYAVIPSSWVNSSVLLLCRHDRVTREVGRVGLVGRDQGRRG